MGYPLINPEVCIVKKIALFSTALALFACLPSQAGWLTGQTLLQVGSGDAGGEYTWFQIAGTAVNPAGCSSTDIYIVRTLPRNALSILLAGKLSGSPVRLYVHDTLCDAYTGRPLVKEVALQ
jgi:hypothetical protein